MASRKERSGREQAAWARGRIVLTRDAMFCVGRGSDLEGSVDWQVGRKNETEIKERLTIKETCTTRLEPR